MKDDDNDGDNSKKRKEDADAGGEKNALEDFPEEDDTHYQLFGKRAWDVVYGEKCASCGKRIDEFGFCACGSAQ
jgi:hypothetical protein